ncbi:hypothetical protein V8C42DRAFT_352761 [Trichoderma barbatum]
MNILWLVLSIFFSFVQRSCAYKERGIAERFVPLSLQESTTHRIPLLCFLLTIHVRALYYVAYLAEGELHALDKSTKLTIAPGCVGKKGGRCDFGELALYIWAPKKKGMEKPSTFEPNATPKIIDLKRLDATSAFNKYIGEIGKARFNTGEPLDGEIDVGKLMPGKSDFYDALSSMGDPIGALAAEIDKREGANEPGESSKFKRTEKQDKAIKWGRAAAFYVSVLRGKDQDHYRRPFLEKYFERKFPREEGKKKITMQMMDVETPMHERIKDKDKSKRKGKKPEWGFETVSMIDFTGTIKENKEKLDGFKEKLEEANAAFMAMEKTVDGKVENYNEAHKKAFAASKMATSATACTRELPHELKKRNAWAELSSRSPKASKSMRVKAQKLGFTV